MEDRPGDPDEDYVPKNNTATAHTATTENGSAATTNSAPAGRKVGIIAARRTGRIRGLFDKTEETEAKEESTKK